MLELYRINIIQGAGADGILKQFLEIRWSRTESDGVDTPRSPVRLGAIQLGMKRLYPDSLTDLREINVLELLAANGWNFHGVQQQIEPVIMEIAELVQANKDNNDNIETRVQLNTGWVGVHQTVRWNGLAEALPMREVELDEESAECGLVKALCANPHVATKRAAALVVKTAQIKKATEDLQAENDRLEQEREVQKAARKEVFDQSVAAEVARQLAELGIPVP